MTANLNKAHAVNTIAWMNSLLTEARPALFFGQELRLSQAQQFAASSGYHLISPQISNPRWWMGSWILVRDDLTVEEGHHEYWSRFECYVAAGMVTLPELGNVRVVSAHASPKLVTTDVLSMWGDDLPGGRVGPTGRANALRYADLVLHAIGTTSMKGPLLAAGDFNESRHYDEPLGKQFFELVHQSNLIDVTYSRWGHEKQTHFDPRHPQLQVDHVFATPDINQLVVDAPRLDPLWMSPESRVDRSDHAPVWFKLATSA